MAVHSKEAAVRLQQDKFLLETEKKTQTFSQWSGQALELLRKFKESPALEIFDSFGQGPRNLIEL